MLDKNFCVSILTHQLYCHHYVVLNLTLQDFLICSDNCRCSFRNDAREKRERYSRGTLQLSLYTQPDLGQSIPRWKNRLTDFKTGRSPHSVPPLYRATFNRSSSFTGLSFLIRLTNTKSRSHIRRWSGNQTWARDAHRRRSNAAAIPDCDR